ncbi:MAG: hypothetical protein VX083_15855 [Pseudomonadota bacterium]|jgi:hypothetical protein|nr:hypothetical protein [Pseudomonadota bacterium]MEC8294967.1 hypothetical protein [Pseudomonadota bacterium]
MSTQLLALAAGYFLCSAAAEEQVLPKAKIDECNAIYTQLKLSFTDVATLDDFMALLESDRAAVNQQGYAGYISWVEDNPELVADLRAEAQLKLLSFNF